MSVVSRSNGWLTVDTRTLSRKQAFEKQMERKANNNKVTSPLSPDWMQRVNVLAEKAKDAAEARDLERKDIAGQITRLEERRVLLYDRKQPLRTDDAPPNQSTNNLFGRQPRIASRRQV